MKSSKYILLLVGLTLLSGCTNPSSGEESSTTTSESISVEVSVPSEEVTSESSEELSSEEPSSAESSQEESSEASSAPSSEVTVYEVWTPTGKLNFTPLPSYTGTFWNTINYNLSGQDLKTAIKTYMGTKFVGVNYATAYTAVTEMDRDPNNSSNILSLYDLKSHYSGGYNGGKWNREHTFPQSKLKDGDESLGASNTQANISSDIANIFACDADMNTKRSNNSYAEFNFETDPETFYNFAVTNTAGEKTDSILRRGFFSPTRMVRGEVARAQLYMLLMYPDRCSINENFAIDVMLRWDLEYPPTVERDGQRQTGIEKWQKVRNPFIDKRDLGCKIWGDTNNFTRNVCGITA